MVVVTPGTARSFYLDYKDGSEKLETFIVTELLDHPRAQDNSFDPGLPGRILEDYFHPDSNTPSLLHHLMLIGDIAYWEA